MITREDLQSAIDELLAEESNPDYNHKTECLFCSIFQGMLDKDSLFVIISSGIRGFAPVLLPSLLLIEGEEDEDLKSRLLQELYKVVIAFMVLGHKVGRKQATEELTAIKGIGL